MSRLYVGRLNVCTQRKHIEEFFKDYGKITEIILKDGFAFVDFDDPQDADDAVFDLDGKMLLEESILVEHAKGVERTRPKGYRSPTRSRTRSNSRDVSEEKQAAHTPVVKDERGARSAKYGPPIRTEWEVRVENLSSRVSWQDLKDYCRPHGEVTYADAHKPEKNKAVVTFRTKQHMENAIEHLNGSDLNGKILKLTANVTTRSTSRSPSKSPIRSRSPSRSRSRSRSRKRSHSDKRSHSHKGSDKSSRSHSKHHSSSSSSHKDKKQRRRSRSR